MSEGDKFRSELGMTRRDLLRRGAIVGGTLLWAAPIIQSIRTPAFAQTASATCFSCCCCVNPVTTEQGSPRCQQDHFTFDACGVRCANFGGIAPSGYCAATTDANGSSSTGVCTCVGDPCTFALR
jgi:hypothetical protein